MCVFVMGVGVRKVGRKKRQLISKVNSVDRWALLLGFLFTHFLM